MGMSWSSGWFCQYSSETHTHDEYICSVPYRHTGQCRCVSGGGERRPRLTQDEQQLLGSAQSKHRDEAAALPVDDVVDGVAEAGLPLLPLLMNVGSIRGLLSTDNHDQTYHPD